MVIVGRGVSGKSALAARLAEITGLPVVELDKLPITRPTLTSKLGGEAILPAPQKWPRGDRFPTYLEPFA